MFYIIENQHRPDGIINNQCSARTTRAAALSYYHERYSKMCVNEEFVRVSLLLVDENLNVIQHDDVETLYQEQEEEQEGEQTEP